MLWPSSTVVRVAVASIRRLTISAMPGMPRDSGGIRDAMARRVAGHHAVACGHEALEMEQPAALARCLIDWVEGR